jgi:hypothetical protein
MNWYIWEKFRIRSILFRIRNKFRINLFRITVNFFLTDTCIGIIKSSGVSKNCPNSKFPDKSSVGLKRFDCDKDYFIRVRHYKAISFGFEAQKRNGVFFFYYWLFFANLNKDYFIRVRHYKAISFGFEAQKRNGVFFFLLLAFFCEFV